MYKTQLICALLLIIYLKSRTSTELNAPTATTPAHVCPTLSINAIRNITYAENALLNVYIFGHFHSNLNEDYTVYLERDQTVFIKCTSKKLQNARIKIYCKKRNEKDFDCIDKDGTITTNLYDKIVCVNIGDDNIPSFRSAFIHIYGPRTETLETGNQPKTIALCDVSLHSTCFKIEANNKKRAWQPAMPIFKI